MMASRMQASPGTWVRLMVRGEAWPATMSIGDEPPQPAFIDHVKNRGRIETWVQRRCPDLPPGVYAVRVQAGDGVLATLSIV